MDIYELIAHVQPLSDDEQKQFAHERPLPISRKAWHALADDLTDREKQPIMIVPSTQCFTMRLDVRNMSTIRTRLCSAGVLSPGWDARFGGAMEAVTRRLCAHFRAAWGYTQSDEITLVLVPSANPNYQHPNGGRRDKLTTESAALASVWLQHEMAERCDGWSAVALNCTLTFDSRIGVYDTLRSAFRLILWRAYDCSVNAVSDAVHHCPLDRTDPSLPTRKQLGAMHTAAKLEYLRDRGLLPLPIQQAHGVLLVKTVVAPASPSVPLAEDGVAVPPLRAQHVIERFVPAGRCVINLVKEGLIAP